MNELGEALFWLGTAAFGAIASWLDRAAVAAHTRAAARDIGRCGDIIVGVPRQADGIGWVSLQEAHDPEPRTCLEAGSARRLAKILRDAAKPPG